MLFTGLSILISIVLLLLMLAAMHLGNRIGLSIDAKAEDEYKRGTGAVEGSLFALLGLLLAFTFAGAAARFEVRRDQIIEEANCVGTAYLRLDILPADRQPALRQLFRDYVDERLKGFELTPDPAAETHFARANEMQTQIWRECTAACAEAGNPAVTSLVLAAMNQMFDIASSRAAARLGHPPLPIFILLVSAALACSAMAGRDMASRVFRKRLYRFGFAFMVSLTVFVIVDLEFPRIGFMQLDRYDAFLMQVRKSMD